MRLPLLLSLVAFSQALILVSINVDGMLTYKGLLELLPLERVAVIVPLTLEFIFPSMSGRELIEPIDVMVFNDVRVVLRIEIKSFSPTVLFPSFT